MAQWKMNGPGGCCCGGGPPPCMCGTEIDYGCKCLSVDYGSPTSIPSAVISISGSCVSKPLQLPSNYPGYPVGVPTIECAPIDNICDCSSFNGMTVECSTPADLQSGAPPTSYCKWFYVCSDNRFDGFGNADYYYVVQFDLIQTYVISGLSCYHEVRLKVGSWLTRVAAGTSVSSSLRISYPDGTSVNGGCGLMPNLGPLTFPSGYAASDTMLYRSPISCKTGWKYLLGGLCTEDCNEGIPVVGCYSGSLTLNSGSITNYGNYNYCDLSGLTIGVTL